MNIKENLLRDIEKMQDRIDSEELLLDNANNHMSKLQALSVLKALRAEHLKMVEVYSKI